MRGMQGQAIRYRAGGAVSLVLCDSHSLAAWAKKGDVIDLLAAVVAPPLVGRNRIDVHTVYSQVENDEHRPTALYYSMARPKGQTPN